MAAIKDVAKLAGFSPAAVSKYLKDPNSVRPATRERIEAAIKELHYIPSATLLVCFFLAEPHGFQDLSSPNLGPWH